MTPVMIAIIIKNSFFISIFSDKPSYARMTNYDYFQSVRNQLGIQRLTTNTSMFYQAPLHPEQKWIFTSS